LCGYIIGIYRSGEREKEGGGRERGKRMKKEEGERKCKEAKVK